MLGGDEKWLKNDQVPFAFGACRGDELKYEEESLFTFIRKKTLYTRNWMKYRAGAITVALNISGPLYLAKADPMATTKSQYCIGGGARGHSLYAYMTCEMVIAISHRRSRYRFGEGLRGEDLCDMRCNKGR